MDQPSEEREGIVVCCSSNNNAHGRDNSASSDPTTKTITNSVMALGSLAGLAIQPAAFFTIPFETVTDKPAVAYYGVWH
jgi:hypothetical protein